MSPDFSGIEQYIANTVSVVAGISNHQEEMQFAAAQANQEKIEREERMVAGAEATIAQKELLEQQVEILLQQKELFSENYSKLKDMYDEQVQANKDAKEELRRSKRFNLAMMIISIIAMLAAIAGPIVTFLVSR